MADADLAGTLTASPEVDRPHPQPPPPPPLPSRAPLLAPREAPLDRALRRLEAFLTLLGFPAAHRRTLRIILSAVAFVLLGVALPSVALALSRSGSGGGGGGGGAAYRIDGFEITLVVSEAAAAAASLACVSRGLVNYGIRRFLFVDQQHGQEDRLQKEYLRKIQVSADHPSSSKLLIMAISSDRLQNLEGEL